MEFEADLGLARRALAGDGAALAELDQLLLREVRRVCAGRLAQADEVAQLARERLLVGKPPRLSLFDGSGPLSAWLRVVVSRVASNAQRTGAREEPVSTLPELPVAGADTELAVLRAQYREHFRAAFAEAVAALEPQDRTVLRLHTLDGLSLASIGTMFRKDASNVSRWLARLRAQLLEDTRQRLAARLSLEGSQLESLMRVADSELTMSLSGILAAR